MNKDVLKYQNLAKETTKPTKQKARKSGEKLVDGMTKEEVVVRYAPLVKYLAQKLALRLPANI